MWQFCPMNEVHLILRPSSLAILPLLAALLLAAACDDAVEDKDAGGDVDAVDAPIDIDREPAPTHDGIYGFANGCYAVEGFSGFAEPSFLQATSDGEAYEFAAEGAEDGARFVMRASDLGTYLLYDAEEHYFVADAAADADPVFPRQARLDSDLTLIDNDFVSPAEWVLEESERDAERFQLRHLQTGDYLTVDGLSEDVTQAAIISFFETTDCAVFPELTVDATGTPASDPWPDGDVFGIAEVHSHMMTNFGFGGGGIFHGAPFHRLGVEHALPDCDIYHGEEGRRDIVGYFYEGDIGFDFEALIPIIADAELPEFNHHTDGYPTFTDWPSSWGSTTHQVMYYRWLERAWMAGLRLNVQLATGNSVLCDFVTGIDAQKTRYSCNDMVGVDRTIEEFRSLERYVDAQWGGPGRGWFRIVESPAEARQVINEGKLAIILGIEISNLFDCFLTPPAGFPVCDNDQVVAALDRYQELGVSVVFPVHKYDNGFAPGDGSGGIIELGNFINSGHYSNFEEPCPSDLSGFDGGNISFAGLNRVREEYFSTPPFDMSRFADDPILTLLPVLDELQAGSATGEFCQAAGMTDLGETLIHEMMLRGMLPDIAHLPERAVARALEILEDNNYPSLATHGGSRDGGLYRVDGIKGGDFGGCGNPDNPGRIGARYTAEVEAREAAGIFGPAPLSFDLNGFAFGRRPRFGEDGVCGPDQQNPVEWPFTSYAGDVEFQQPRLGERVVDFNTEGFAHIGLLPELIEDARRDGMSDEDLEPLFRSAESYIRMWERAETRAAELRAEAAQ